MSFLGNFKKTTIVNKNPLLEIYDQLDTYQESPFTLAQMAYEKLRASAKNQSDFFYYLIEDSLFTSLYATFYEQLLVALKDNMELKNRLIEKFAEDTKDREQIIASQTQNHLEFIENLGMCEGCPSCDNHQDVAELIEPFQKGDIDFFTTLFIGMQTIQYSMEYLIYDFLPNDDEILTSLTMENILEFRQHIFDNVVTQFSN